MPTFDVNNEEFADIVAKAVKEILAREQSQLAELKNGFLDEAQKSQRTALKDLEDSIDGFNARSRTRLAEADAEIGRFESALAEKKKKVEEALNAKVLGGFTAVVVVLGIIAVGTLVERASTVNDKTKELTKAAEALKTSSDQLEGSIKTATDLSAKFNDSAKNSPDVGSQLQIVNRLASSAYDQSHKSVGEVQAFKGELQLFKKQVKPLLDEYARLHKQ